MQLIFILAGLLIAAYLLTGGEPMGTGYEDLIMKWAQANLPSGWQVQDFYNLIRAVITHESNWNPNIVGVTGDIGLMQINPVNAPAFNLTKDQLFDPDTNIYVGTSILRDDINNYGLVEGLGAYNAGPGKRNISVAQRYAQAVIGIYNNLQTAVV